MPIRLRTQRELFSAVYVDLDDVIAATALTLTEVLLRQFDRRVPFESIFSFNLGESFSLAPNELREFMHVAHQDDVLESIRPIPGAREGLAQIRRAGGLVSVVTGRPIMAYDATEAWLRCNSIPFDSLCFVRKYKGNEVDGDTIRRPVALRTLAKMTFSFAIEDSTKMTRFLVQQTQTPVLLFDRPWNSTLPTLADHHARLVTRCHDWNALTLRAIDLLAIAQSHPQ
jgi:uncharacterized HAD superfamily protein